MQKHFIREHPRDFTSSKMPEVHFCVVARRNQLQILKNVLEKRFEVKQTGHIGFSVGDAKELKMLNQSRLTCKMTR